MKKARSRISGFTPPLQDFQNRQQNDTGHSSRYRLMRRISARAGFTLIELLVVIAIIGVLASIVLASLNSARRKSRDARRITDIKQIQLALELYFDANASQYPAASATCNAATNAYGLELLSTGGYIPQISRDPLSTTAAPICYFYATPTGTRTTYHLGATLEEATHPALNGDKDCTSSGTATCVSGVTAYTNGFAGTDPVYDVIP